MTNSVPHSRTDSRRSGERGYAMLMAISLTMMVLIASTAMIANLRIEGKRQREDEAIWRGNQYARAIRLYFRKTGHYPQTLEDLQKGMPQLHFLRQAYKDPLNTSDGSWRFIYVNAAGQIIGSTKYTSLQQMALYDSGALQNGVPGQIPGLVGTPVSSLTNSSGFGDVNGTASSGSSNSAQNPSLAPTDPNAPPQAPGTSPGQSPDQSGQNPPGSQASHRAFRTAEPLRAARCPGPARHSSGAKSIRVAERAARESRRPAKADGPGGRPGPGRVPNRCREQSGLAFAEGLSPRQKVHSVGVRLESARRSRREYAAVAQSSGPATGNRPADWTGWNRRNRFANK